MASINKLKFFNEIGYKPHPKQRLYHHSKSRFKVATCGRRFGKSTMAARDLEPELFLPNRRYWIAAPTYDLGEKEFRVVWHDLLTGQKLADEKKIKRAYSIKTGNMFIEFPWNTRLEVRSAQHPENLVGEGLHGVIMSEAAKHAPDTWERYIRPALADYRGWASFPTTPEGQNWLYKVWQYGQNPRPEYKDFESWRFPSWENPYLYPEGYDDPEIQQLLLTTSKEWFDQEIAADFTAFVGRVYHEFQETTHVKAIEYNPEWPNYIAFDWGFSHPLAAIEFQVDGFQNVYIWREYYETQKSLQTHLHDLSERPQPPYYKIDLCFGDAAEPGAVVTTTENFMMCIADPMAKKDKNEGIELVKTFLKEYETGEHDETGAPIMAPKLFIDHSCTNTIREFNNYRAKEPPRTGRNRSDGQDEPQKFDDHALDAIRYGLMHIFKLGAQHHLSDTEPSLTGRSTASSTIFSSSSMEF